MSLGARLQSNLPYRLVICALNGISIGSIINYCAMAGSQYYVCNSLETMQMQLGVAIDFFRIVCALAALFFPELMSISFSQKGAQYLNRLLCGISIACIIAVFIIWHSACEECVQRENDVNLFQAGLTKMLKAPGDITSNDGGPCNGGLAAGKEYWFNAQSYCREQIAVNCNNAFSTSDVSKIRSIQGCARFGCTNFLPEGQASFVIGIVGDFARVFLFFIFATHPDSLRAQAGKPKPHVTTRKVHPQSMKPTGPDPADLFPVDKATQVRH